MAPRRPASRTKNPKTLDAIGGLYFYGLHLVTKTRLFSEDRITLKPFSEPVGCLLASHVFIEGVRHLALNPRGEAWISRPVFLGDLFRPF